MMGHHGLRLRNIVFVRHITCHGIGWASETLPSRVCVSVCVCVCVRARACACVNVCVHTVSVRALCYSSIWSTVAALHQLMP